MTKLIIGDPHATPEADNERFDWLGRYIIDRQPDEIICLGDFACMPSLSSYDKFQRSFEGRRYHADIAAANDALARIDGPRSRYNRQKARNKEKQYRPKMIMLGGNHDEGRIERVTQFHPELYKTIGIEDILYAEHGWTYVPYKSVYFSDGVAFSHHFASGGTGKPIGGLHHAHQLNTKHHMSTVCGHSHMYDRKPGYRADGTRFWGLVAGCFFEHTPEFAKDSAAQWWRGVIEANNFDGAGDYSIREVPMEELKGDYWYG